MWLSLIGQNLTRFETGVTECSVASVAAAAAGAGGGGGGTSTMVVAAIIVGSNFNGRVTVWHGSYPQVTVFDGCHATAVGVATTVATTATTTNGTTINGESFLEKLVGLMPIFFHGQQFALGIQKVIRDKVGVLQLLLLLLLGCSSGGHVVVVDDECLLLLH